MMDYNKGNTMGSQYKTFEDCVISGSAGFDAIVYKARKQHLMYGEKRKPLQEVK